MRAFLSLLAILPSVVLAQTQFQPYEGQAGKDVIWVPTPPALVEKMLDMVQVTPRDFVMDLGSGDGRNIIAAAKRGVRGLGVEYDPDMVALSQRLAQEAGVADKAQFVRGDMYEADISRATALVLFLLPINLEKLAPKFLQLPPGTRIVNNGYKIPGWEEVDTGHLGVQCVTWCTAYLYLVPAQLKGAWRLPAGVIEFEQDFQALTGRLATSDGRSLPVQGSVKGDRVLFSVGLDTYSGRVRGKIMNGAASGATAGYWKATRIR